MTQDYKHPITPPEDLAQEWFRKWNCEESVEEEDAISYIAARAAQWGADQELEACMTFVKFHEGESLSRHLRDTRRPKPPTLKEQAFDELDRIPTHDSEGRSVGVDVSILRRALEALPND